MKAIVNERIKAGFSNILIAGYVAFVIEPIVRAPSLRGTGLK
jgi:hypothetical protein